MKEEEIVILLLAFVTGFVFSQMMRSNVVERSGHDGQVVTFYSSRGGICGNTSNINSYLNNLENVTTTDDLHSLTDPQRTILNTLCENQSTNEVTCSFDPDQGCRSQVMSPH
tara:strand:+ start:283 stop:618 length:336 start_codon:yes stop_codon:yes gene_type:complete